MVVKMHGALRLRLTNYCGNAYPAEACGFITGDFDAASGCMEAADLLFVRNISKASERRFEMDPMELIQRLADTPAQRLLGIFHSHPRTAPIPSRADLQTAWYTLPSYWIVSLADVRNPTVAAYRLERRGDKTIAVPLTLEQKEDFA